MDPLEIGRIHKPHGLAGAVLVSFIDTGTSRALPGAEFQTARGPLTVVHAQPHQQRWLVRFAEITGREQAESWRGVALLAPPVPGADTLYVHELVGATVVEADGTLRGTVVEVQDNPAAELMVLDSGALVPVNFIVGFEATTVTVDVPDGLFEL